MRRYYFGSIRVETVDGRVVWTSDWPRVARLVRVPGSGVTERCHGPDTYGHVTYTIDPVVCAPSEWHE